MLIERAQATPLFAATPGGPRQIVRVTLSGGEPGAAAAGPVLVRVEGAGISTPAPFRIEDLSAGSTHVAEVAVSAAVPYAPGSRRPVTVIAEGAAGRAEHAAEITLAETGWTIWMVCHFHYDPVWWNTQGEFTQTQFPLPGEGGGLPEVRPAFELVRLHLDAARDDPDYKFVLAEIDYLKPYFDSHPADRAELRELIAAGRVEIVGGAYNEPNTNLTSAESTIRNIVYGLGHQRGVLGADPSLAWALDAFGHDPGYPGLMAAAGMTGSAWARGPYHQWGPWRTVGSNERMQFASEFEWVSPDGHGLLTGYMPNHYGAGWELHQAPDAAAACEAALTQLALLAPVAATPNVLLPVGADHVIPARWATAVHRDFAARYAWPRCVTGLPREFFAAVREQAAQRGIWLTPQSRDMNPVYPGKDVTYIDTKQAQRAAEVAVSDGERLATLAWLAGARYPAEGLDKAWRQLVFGAHHDAITGTESDQVYLDLLGGWREAFERGDAAKQEAVSFLAGLVDTQISNGASAAGGASAARAGAAAGSRPLVVFNTLSWPRRGLATVTLGFSEPGSPWLALHDESGGAVPFLAEGVGRHAGGGLAAATVTFLADLPALGYRTYWVSDVGGEGEVGWREAGGTVIANEAFEVRADPAAGGTLAAIVDRRTGTSLLRGAGNELVLADEYASHPRWGEGPWLLSPKGPGTGSAGVPARVRAERCPAGSRLVAEFSLDGLRVCQETLLWDGLDLVEFRTHVDGSIGQDRMLRAAFGVDVPGGLPVFQCATAVVGRPFGIADSDVAEHAFTLDNPAHEWFGLGSTARVAAGGRDWAIGVAEIIVPGPAAPAGTGGGRDGWREAVRGLVAALARAGVTATCTVAGGPRYGALDLDSNLPDCRIVLGGPVANAWTGELLSALGPGEAAALREGLSAPAGRAWVAPARPRAEVFTASADVRGLRDLPVLVVAGDDLGRSAAALAADLADGVIEAGAAVGDPVDPPLAGHSVALLNRGTPSSLVTPDGTLHITLMRSCSAWPCGVWIDGERRTAPDGSSFAWQHWSHTFRYALAAGPGDWRRAGFGLAGLAYNHDLITCETGVHAGPLPAAASLCEVSTPGGGPPAAALSALKPHGNPLASGQRGQPVRGGDVTVRLRDGGGPPGSLTQAGVTLFPGIAAARVTGLTEPGDGAAPAETGAAAAGPAGPGQDAAPAVQVRDGRMVTGAPVAGLVTATVSPVAWAAGGEPGGPPGEGPACEPAQPVFTRYWLHGKGPAPAGNLPVAVHLSPGQVALGAGGQASGGGAADGAALAVTVACGPVPAGGQVTLDVPPGLTVTGPDGEPAGPLCYSLTGGGYAAWDLRVRAHEGTPNGRYFVAARITDGLGQALEDVALVTVGEPAPPARGMPRGELEARLAAGAAARTAELGVTMGPGELHVAAGGCARLTVTLANHTASEVRGECQLVSPFGSWELARPWTRGFAAGPGATTSCEFTIAPPATARPGSQLWAVAKVMYFGRVRHTDSALIQVTAPAGTQPS